VSRILFIILQIIEEEVASEVSQMTDAEMIGKFVQQLTVEATVAPFYPLVAVEVEEDYC
jgi:hypothetical protein